MAEIRHLSRGMALAMALVVSLVSGACAEETPRGYVDWYRSATSAYEAGDYPAYLAAVRGALAVRPDYPPMLYNLAAAEARTDNPGGALALLERLARMGLAYDPTDDPDFATLAQTPAFATVARRLVRNSQAQGAANLAFSLPRVDFIPEGIAWDPRSGRFFVGSIRTGMLLTLNPQRDRQPRPFIQGGAGGPWSLFGMQVDTAGRRLILASAAIAEHEDLPAEEIGKTAIFIYALDEAKLIDRYDFPPDGKPHVLGDVIAGPDETLFTTDSLGGGIYRIDEEDGSFHALVEPGHLVSPQGLTLGRGDKVLYFTDYRGPIYRLDLGSGEYRQLPVPADVSAYGIDGLYRYGDSLIAIQNGISPHRVMRFGLDARGERIVSGTVLVAALPEFDEPTLGVIADKAFYFAVNSQWGRFDEHGALPALDELQPPLIYRVALD